MNAASIAAVGLIAFVLAYRIYGRFLAKRVFEINENEVTPAVALSDGIDYVPTSKHVLFGHHFASIAGAAPIVGPSVAVIWGWAPALLWVIFGTIFIGAAHDFGSLVISMKYKGHSIGQVTKDIIGPRSQNLFLVVIFFLVWLVIAVFALVIANLFISFPGSVIPVNFEIIIAVLIGYFINRKGKSILWPSILAQLGLFVCIYLGTQYPISLDPVFGDSSRMAWIVFLLIYSFVASVLPVWTLLQPRDFINSHQLTIGLGAMFLGLFIVQPEIVAPALNLAPEGAPSWIPFLFITIACGAISGFHGLVSSGTTSKQVKSWRDAKHIGYGGMLGEGALALLATLAATAGFQSQAEWHDHYGSWTAAKGLGPAIEAFVGGGGKFLAGLGISVELGQTFIAVLVISFAATSLDTATRIQRYVIGELGENWKAPVLRNRYLGGLIAVMTAFLLMVFKKGGTGGLTLWPLFGATNQMLGALTLVIISVFLLKQGKKATVYLVPLIFLIFVTMFGLVGNVMKFFVNGDYLLGSLSFILTAIEVWIIGEAWVAIRKVKMLL